MLLKVFTIQVKWESQMQAFSLAGCWVPFVKLDINSLITGSQMVSGKDLLTIWFRDILIFQQLVQPSLFILAEHLT